jgi:putative transposase
VVSWASRKVLAHRVTIMLEVTHAVEVLEAAFARYGQSEIINTNQGSQLTANAFIEAVLGRGIRVSMQSKKLARQCVVERGWQKITEKCPNNRGHFSRLLQE